MTVYYHHNQPEEPGASTSNHDTHEHFVPNLDSEVPIANNNSDELLLPTGSADFVPPVPPLPPAPPSPPPAPRVTQSGRPQRNYQVPRRYVDLLPEAVPIQDAEAPNVLPRRVRLYMRDRLRTAANIFGVWREYLYRPSYDPESAVRSEDLRLANQTPIDIDNDDGESEDTEEPELSVHGNKTTQLIMEWLNTGAPTKSNAEVNRLVHEYVRHPDFKPNDLQGFDASRENCRIDALDTSGESPLPDSFQTTSINIEIPTGIRDAPPHVFPVPGLYYRRLTASIRAAFSSPIATHFHYSPFKQFRTSPVTGEPERIFSEIYDSDALIEEHDKIRRSAPTDDPDCKCEKGVAAVMFWSDSTHLANFGTAKLWPVYMLFGNLSKYIRGQPTSGACQHVAYIPSLPDIIDDTMKVIHASWKTQKQSIITHCRRELMHAIWKFLLDDDFVHAYKYGMVIKCADGVDRRIYPRIITYSADYPEKYYFVAHDNSHLLNSTDFRVLLATIRDQGICPCPRCLMPKARFDRMGLTPDTTFRLNHCRKVLSDLVHCARQSIYKYARAIGGSTINRILKPTSSVPTEVCLDQTVLSPSQT